MDAIFVRKLMRKLRARRKLPPEFRVGRTQDFALLYKLASDPWNISKRVTYYGEVWEWILHQLPEPLLSVVDAGCGVGAFLKSLTILCPEVLAEGIEFSQDAAERARQATGLTIHLGDISKEVCFRTCQPVLLLTLNDILCYLPKNGEQGIINCLRFLQPRYVLISHSPVENEDIFLVYQRPYSLNSTEASLVKIASRAFALPKELGWAGTHLFVLYQVMYKY